MALIKFLFATVRGSRFLFFFRSIAILKVDRIDRIFYIRKLFEKVIWESKMKRFWEIRLCLGLSIYLVFSNGKKKNVSSQLEKKIMIRLLWQTLSRSQIESYPRVSFRDYLSRIFISLFYWTSQSFQSSNETLSDSHYFLTIS